MDNDNTDGGILKRDFQEKSNLTILHHFVHWPCNLRWTVYFNSVSLSASFCTVKRSFRYAWEFLARISGIEIEPKPALWDWWYCMIFLNSSLASKLDVAPEWTQLPAFTETDADAKKESLD